MISHFWKKFILHINIFLMNGLRYVLTKKKLKEYFLKIFGQVNLVRKSVTLCDCSESN